MLFCYVFLFLSVFCICCSSSVDENSLSAKDTLSLSEVIIKPSINDSDFQKYRTFNELKMKGEGLLNEQDDSFFVLVKETADSIMVIRSDNPRHTIVYKRKAGFIEGVVMLHRHFHIDVIPLSFTIDDLGIKRFVSPV